MSEKSFLMILGPIWSKIVFWKRKLPNLPKNTENARFFEFPKITKWPEVADNYSKTSALPQSLSKNFFVSPQNANVFFFFWGGGGDDIKCRFRRVWRNMDRAFEIISIILKIYGAFVIFENQKIFISSKILQSQWFKLINTVNMGEAHV